MTDRKFGWKKEKHDSRDKKYAAIRHLEVGRILPKSVTLEEWCGPVLDQGSSSSCVGNSTSTAITFLRLKEADLPDWVASRMYIWYMTRKQEGTADEDEGCCIRNAIKITGKLGVPPEDLWPFNLTKYAEEPSDEVKAEALQHKTFNYYRVDWTDLNEVKGCLAAGYPIVFGMMVPPGLQSEEVAKTGVLEMITDPHTEFSGGHAVLAIGYDDNRNAVLVRNSWGKDWGINGCFWLPYDYVTDPHLSDDFWTIRATF